ncbi:MAG: DUF3488 and transglutaminase-like domain-containing protein [Actinomycetota bacterium]|nr:transglutaminaseTgpA domain-containing protein [Actinomycetota bacterium]
MSIVRIGLAGFLSSAAAAWMVAGVFTGAIPRLIAISACAVGALSVVASYASKRPSLFQALVLPGAVIVGSALVLPFATGGNANLPHLVLEVLKAGGLAQPPISFDPGWRFVIFVFFAVLSSAAVALPSGTARTKLSVVLPLPVIMAAALVQPPHKEVVTSSVTIALVMASLSVAYGTDLARQADGTSGFELRRLARGFAMIGVLLIAMFLLGNAGFLFPDTARQRVVPPQKPHTAAAPGDRVLFIVTSAHPGPWRLGVLDVYDGRSWLLPPFDPSRFVDLKRPEISYASKIDTSSGTEKSDFAIADVEGHSVPDVAVPISIEISGADAQFDPRTQTLRLFDRRAFKGLRYTVTSPLPPGGAQLAKAGPPSEDLKPYLQVPTPPNEVVSLLANAPVVAWDRLQFARAKFYEKVVAAGAGDPVDVSPRRVVELLAGREGTPFEITASEALIARWAGVPSRIGYGYYSGDIKGTGRYEVHPRNGASWLEAYFQGFGWVPIVGIPPHAKSSLTDQQKNPNSNVKPTEDLGLVVYVPIKLRTVRLFYLIARYWIGIGLLLALAIALAWWALPGLAKGLRRPLRRSWANKVGLKGRIMVAYAELRDAATDLNIGKPSMTPIEFIASMDDDDENEELAWLVTRSLWGDLQRDLRVDDVRSAEEMAQSIARRMRKGAPAFNRLVAIGSRASLRDPFSSELPNPWRHTPERVSGEKKRTSLRRILPAWLSIFVLFAACASDGIGISKTRSLPAKLAPLMAGQYELRREPKAEIAYKQAGGSALVGQGRVFTIRQGSVIQGSIQIAPFKQNIDTQDPEIKDAILHSIGSGRFTLRRLGAERVWSMQLPEQQVLLWFAPGGAYMQLLVSRKSFVDSSKVFLDVLRFRSGDAEVPEVLTSTYDPRRGGDA